MSENNEISKIVKNPLQLKIYPPSQVLRQVARPVEVFSDDIPILAAQMLDFMRWNDGVGLAAPQIGLSRQIIVLELHGRSYCMINPTISPASSDWETMEECCLSLPGKAVDVKRHKHVQIQGQDTAGKPKTLLAEGLLARVFQHEIDHLNGVMICDYEF